MRNIDIIIRFSNFVFLLQARQYFLEGVEHEQNGELFEAIQKYRKAVALVPDIEFKTFEHTKTSKRRPKKVTKEETIEETDEEEVPDLPEDHDDEDEFQVDFSICL